MGFGKRDAGRSAGKAWRLIAACVACAGAVACAGEAPSSEADAVVGTWTLVSYEAENAEGEVRRPMGEGPSGFLVYDAAGNMSVMLMESGRPPFAVADRMQGTPEEVLRAYNTFMAYYGRYTLDLEEGTVTHHIRSSSFPNWEGTDQLRYFELDGDRVILTTPTFSLDGEDVVGELIWERMDGPRPRSTGPDIPYP